MTPREIVDAWVSEDTKRRSMTLYRKPWANRAYLTPGPMLSGSGDWNQGRACDGLYVDLETGALVMGLWAGPEDEYAYGEAVRDLERRLG